MIVKMLKAYAVSRRDDQQRLLEALREMGVVHLKPIDPARAVADEKTLAAIDRLGRAAQMLAGIPPTGERPDMTAQQAADEAMDIQRRAAEGRSRLQALHRQIDQLAMWGDATLERFGQLREAGVEVRFFWVQEGTAGQIAADCVEPIGLPRRDRPSLREEARDVDAALQADQKRLRALAHLADEMAAERGRLQERAQFMVARGSGLAGEDLYAVQGWVPSEQADRLADALAAADVAAGVQTMEAAEDETPPTLIRYPSWARPIKGLFDVLGTVPGYREIDLSGFFMLALPVFAAMLIGDAGYGLLFVVVPALIYRKAVAAAGKPGVHLLIVMGIATIVWGILTGVYFGVSPRQMIGAGGALGGIGEALGACQVIRGDVKEQAYLIMKISFVMAGIHLSLGQLRQALDVAPDLKMLGKIGWAVFLWGIFFVIWYLFFDSQAKRPPHWLTPYLLCVGAALAILFAAPSRNPVKMIGLGLADFPLSALGAFSDSISYIRLMGVGLASTIIGQTFNNLGAGVASAATWAVGGAVVLFGHGLNIAMCMIAVLAHGVRLNMLEFSNNAGVQWAGYAYEPFAKTVQKEL